MAWQNPTVAPNRVRVTEVGPRDGLQNESAPIPTATKIAFIEALTQAGPAEIEVTSFVAPTCIPQLADAAEVFAGLRRRRSDIVYSALVPNERGLERALSAGADKIAVFTSASETFAQRNINASIAESIARFGPVIEGARGAGKPVRGYVSCVVACPFEGPVQPTAVANIARLLLDAGVDEIDLGDTIGVAVPTDISRLYREIASVISPDRTTLHMHDTRGTALACVIAALDLGVRSFDSSAGGLGGCPFAPGAAGNLGTEDLVYCLHRMGYETGIDLARLVEATAIIENFLGRPLTARAYRALRSAHPTTGASATPRHR